MAALQGAFRTGSVALAAGVAKTTIQIVAPTNQRLKITKIKVSFDGTNSANTPATIQLCRQTTAGTFTNTSVAPVKTNDPTAVGETLQAVAQTAVTSEPTVGDIIDQFSLPVFGGTLVEPYTPGEEILIPGGTRLGVLITAAQVVNVFTVVSYEE